tara:strand:+ start:129 stop:383 length:255 start_codon:yes stop_codon:yes gene_type:complete
LIIIFSFFSYFNLISLNSFKCKAKNLKGLNSSLKSGATLLSIYDYFVNIGLGESPKNFDVLSGEGDPNSIPPTMLPLGSSLVSP